MNRMDFESIKHSAAKQVFSGTEYDWTDMLDNTAEAEQSVRTLDNEEDLKFFWLAFFRDRLAAMRYSDRDDVIAQYGMEAKFHIQSEYAEQWGDQPDDYVVTMEEAIHLADEWNKPLRTLVEQLDEI